MALLQRVSEALARTTTRRGLFGRGTDLAFGALAGAAAGTALRPDSAGAGIGTICGFPGPPCACDECARSDGTATGVCGKPCLILTLFYASGCWVTAGVTCCDCTCTGACGCGSDYHNDPAFCP